MLEAAGCGAQLREENFSIEHNLEAISKRKPHVPHMDGTVSKRRIEQAQ